MSAQPLLYLSRADVESVALDMPTIINLLEAAFKEKGQGQVEMPPKPGIHTQPDAFIHAMPAYIPSLRAAGLKWVSGYPDNKQRGLPYITGLLILNDVETGIPYAVMDCTWITAYRTGAARRCQRNISPGQIVKSPAFWHAGYRVAQIYLALSTLFPIKRVYAYDTGAETQRRYVEEMKTQLGVEVIGVQEPREAVVESDLVVTSGPILKHPTPTIQKIGCGRAPSAAPSISTVIGLPGRWRRSISWLPMITHSFNTTGRPAILRPRPIRMPIWVNSPLDCNPAAKGATNGRWRSTWAWRWMIWPSHRRFIAVHANVAWACGCRCKSSLQASSVSR